MVRFDRGFGLGGLLLHRLPGAGFDPLQNEAAGEDPAARHAGSGESPLPQESIDLLLVDPEVLRRLAGGEHVTGHSVLA